MHHRRRLLPLVALPWLQCLPAWALEVPASEVVLSIGGQVRSPNRRDLAQFDMPMLERLPQTSFVTRTPWFTQPRKFTGPLLREVLRLAGAHGQTLRVTALNDYRVDIPIDDIQRWDVLLARLLDDRPMSVRDKGPLFIIYPLDSRAELRSPLYFSRCAWQLNGIEVL